VIYIGWPDDEKEGVIRDYAAAHDIGKIVVISPAQFPLTLPDADNITYDEVIMYRTFYRLLQEIDGRTLIVLSECLRTQNRYDLTYNCIRNYLNRTCHHLIFQQLPIIDTAEDFMILFDFATGSRWKRLRWDIDLILDNTAVHVRTLPIRFERVDVPTGAATKERYAKERERRFATLGAGDPHTLPRNLYQIGGKDKLAYIDGNGSGQMTLFDRPAEPARYVARNKRLNRANIVTYAEVTAAERPYTLIEFPHRFIDYSDFVKRTGQGHGRVLCADLKVDDWYFNRYSQWSERIHETYASLLQQ
jgi:hypothetical protein